MAAENATEHKILDAALSRQAGQVRLETTP